MALCPGHPDRNTPNLSVTEKEDGAVLVHCFVCNDKEKVLRALEEKGIAIHPKMVEADEDQSTAVGRRNKSYVPLTHPGTTLRTGAMETVPRRTRAPPIGAERQYVARILPEKGKQNKMTFMSIRVDEVIEDGTYDAVLKSIEKNENRHGEYLHWRFTLPEHNAEVSGFSSTSESTQAKAYKWAVALNSELASNVGWEPEDVVGRRCLVVVEAYEDDNSRERNKVVKVKPPKEKVKTSLSEDS
jgi:hypothetical protein